MAQLTNCPNCDRLFVKNAFRDLCDTCYKEEEAAYEKVYQFIRKRENRSATLTEVVNATEVEEKLIIKFIKKGRLRVAQYPNLGYPCQKCGTLIKDGKLCGSCKDELSKQITKLEQEEEFQKQLKERDKHETYFSIKKK